MKPFLVVLATAAAMLLAPSFLAAQPPAAKDSCVTCHSALDGDLQKPASLFKDDVHFSKGLACADCHGGYRTSDDMSVAMDPAKGFKGAPKRTEIPQFCAKCHSDIKFMGKFQAQPRVDQFALYQTSTHGKLLAKGDDNVATCIDCHSVHNIRAVKDPRATVYPLNVPGTCGQCHADPKHMAKYGIPTDQLEKYHTSVHWNALTKGNDLSAPTCASCHGNHGAKPPDVASVSAVCGTCHVSFKEQYDKSVHQPIFSEAPGGGGCVVCHTNHGIQMPSTAMLEGSKAVCTQCHDAASDGGKAAAQMAGWIDGLDSALKRSDAILTSADKSGMEVSEAQLKLADGRENLVKAKLAMHSFNPEEMHKPILAGMAIADETFKAGQSALAEKQYRRWGLAVSSLLIAITLAALWFFIRKMETGGRGYRSSAH